MVLVRQRPGSAKGVVFMTLEDETGIANIVVWPKVMEQYRKEVMGARLILVEGYIQSSPEHVTHLVAQRMFDRSHDLIGLANDALEPQASGAGRPRAGRAAQRRPPRSPRYARAENPPPAQRPHPAAVTGFSLRLRHSAISNDLIRRMRGRESGALRNVLRRYNRYDFN